MKMDDRLLSSVKLKCPVLARIEIEEDTIIHNEIMSF